MNKGAPPTMMSLAAAAVYCGCLTLVSAQIPGFGSCPSQLHSQTSLDVQRYLGLWYELYAFPSIFEWGQTCITANYTLKDNGHIRVHNSGYKDGELKTIIGDAYRPDDSKPGELAVRFDESTPYGAYWVVETDYDNYSVVYSCGGVLGLAHIEQAWVLSRHPTLPSSTIQHTMTLLKDVGVDVGHFRQTYQSSCPGRDVAACRITA